MQDRKATQLELLTRQVRSCFHALARTAEALHDGSISVAQRAILEALFKEGPQTIPEFAERRHVSRQQIQRNVNELLEAGLILTRENPRHKKSFLVVLSLAGRRKMGAMLKREAGALEHIARPLSQTEIQSGLEILQKLEAGLRQLEAESMD